MIMQTPKISVPDCIHCKSHNRSLFHFCHVQESQEINEHKTCALYRKGQVIFHEGANAYGLYCLNAGKVKLFKEAAEGKEQIVRIAVPGDFIGYGAMLADAPYGVTAEVIEDAVICFIPRDVILKLFRENERFSTELVRLLTKTMDETVDKMADIAYKPVLGRMAEALLILHESFKNEQNPDGIIQITRDDLAAYVGTVKETAIRVLKEFRDEGLVSTHNHDITINDSKGLLRICALYD